MPIDDLLLIVRHGRPCCQGAHILAVAGDVETSFYLPGEQSLRRDIAEPQSAF